MRKPRSGDPRRAVAYLRVSTDEQKLGPEAQRSAIEAFAGREGLEVVAWHSDFGISGGMELDDRPGLGAALGALRAHHAGALLVAKRDRLARDAAVAIAIERAVMACGATIVSADGAGNGDGPADEFMRRILDAAAQYERALIRARTRAALAVRRAQGLRVGSVRYGYRLGACGKRLEPNDHEQRIVERVRVLRNEGLSMVAIAARLTGEGIATRSGKPWHPQQVARMLSKIER